MKRRERGRYVWRKLASARWEDAWLERLAWLGPRLAVTIPPGRRMMRLEAYALRKSEGAALVRAFGGAMEKQRVVATAPGTPPRRPISIRGRLLVVSEPEKVRIKVAAPPNPDRIHIPAGMAFGTGEHATTASCLRLLADVSTEICSGHPWDLLDLGTGTGILAIAARILGARAVSACDFDPDAIRVARENIRRNGVDRVAVVRRDVRAWKPDRTWKVIVANLYSELLIEVMPRIARALSRDHGHFIFSGILRSQEASVSAALRRAGFKTVQIVRRGKWVAGRATLVAGGV